MDIYQKLLNIQENAESIHDLLKGYYDLIPSPMAVIDTNYDIVSYFVLNDTIGDDLYNSTMKTGHWNIEIISDVTKHFLESDSNRTIFEYKGRKRLFQKITNENKTIGFLVIVENDKPLEQINQDVLFHLVKSISRKLSSSHTNLSHSSTVALLSSLLNNDIHEEDVMEEKIKEEEIDISCLKQYILISLSGLKKSRYHFFEKDASNIFDDALLLYKDKYLLVFPRGDIHEKKVIDFLSRNQLTAILSTPLFSLFDLSFSYRINAKLLDYLIKKEKQYLLYKEEKHYSLLPIIGIEDKKNLFSMIHPDMMKLWNYDKENNTDYCYTLLIYLSSGKSLMETGNRLSFHKNTIGYRINQIKDIIENDLEDSRICINYISSLATIDYLNYSK